MFQSEQLDSRIPDISDTYGVCFLDADGDGANDIYMIGFRSLNRLLMNQPAPLPFDDATIRSGLGGDLMARGTENLEVGTCTFDMDNDGDSDILIAGWGNTTRLFRNDGNLEFTDIQDQLNLNFPLDINSIHPVDFNNDGYLDLFCTDEHHPNRILLNKKNNNFEDITELSGLMENGISQDAAFCDVEGDGDLDLYICNWSGPDFFYQNRGDGTFKRMNIPLVTCQEYRSTNSASFADIDNDGDFDLFVAYHRGMNFMYINETLPGDTNWTFVDETIERHLSDAALTYGGVIADLNQDGWQDIYITNTGANQLYFGIGQGIFQKVYEDTFSRPIYSTGSALGDIDEDGDLDLFVANKDTFCFLYLNPSNNNNYIKFKIEGLHSNRDGYGTKVDLYKANSNWGKSAFLGSRFISGGNGYLSSNAKAVHFGLGEIKHVDARVFFPSGKIITKRNLEKGKTYTIHEQPYLLRSTVRSGRVIAMQTRRMDFWLIVFLILLFIGQIVILIRLGLKRYEWNAGTAMAYLAGFFFLAFIGLLVLSPLGIVRQFGVINILSLLMTGVLVLYSERISKWRQIRKKYRSILIQLSHDISHLHQEEALLETVIRNIQRNTEFKKCCLVLYDNEGKKCTKIESGTVRINPEEINQQTILHPFVDALGKTRCLSGRNSNQFHSLFQLLDVDFIISIQHEQRFFGWLGLGTIEQDIPFTEEDVELFQSLTTQIAITLDNIYYVRQSNEMIKKLTQAKVQKKYLDELEQKNQVLDETNKTLQKLYEELKSTQSQLIHSEKMASLGQLVAGISHELNNPVAFIYSNIKQLKKYSDKIIDFMNEEQSSSQSEVISGNEEFDQLMPDMQNLIQDTIQGSQMVKSLVENLRRFSHLDGAEKKVANIHEGMESSLMILRPKLKDRIQVHTDYQSKGMIECNPGQLNQVFLNLISNAAQAIKDKGDIWITTRDSKDTLTIEVKDNGKGMSKEIMAKIFDPFYTTKDVGQGTGLGLSISYSIIENHQGKIEVESKSNKGSAFRILLPLK